METLTEVSVSAAVAAEAGQWRWAWSTDAVLARLRRMRADLKRAFAAVDAVPLAAIERVQVRLDGWTKSWSRSAGLGKVLEHQTRGPGCWRMTCLALPAVLRCVMLGVQMERSTALLLLLSRI